MKFSVLSSGSKANCTFVEAEGHRFLIDCGLSCRKTEERLNFIGIEPESVEAILITHEHADHVRGVGAFSKKYKVTVFANSATARFLQASYKIHKFESGKRFQIGNVEINPFSITHDAVDPVGFSIFGDGLKFSQSTDLGRVTPLVQDALLLSNALVLESNHDMQMLWNCYYPWELKQRIASSHGHLDNKSAAELILQLLHPDLQVIVLGHISENSNTPQHALKSVIDHTRPNALPFLLCASPYECTELFDLSENLEMAMVG
ncbi:MAG: MBL fold metallo-hydrolase [SAR324 cluster bacterium]|uniref:MBL fold metallo-hydrolase n=1 Tax=SAR324 cluster bacterium TaxID=2024889 RepID=A0A7X9FP45_9DELT|nr:MBL fold metallo-hydrolase [SAR324 cluster bacterium]